MTSKEIKQEVFSKRLQELIKESNMRLYQVADILNMDKSTISRYINKQMSPKLPTVEMLAKYFNVNPAWLLGYDVSKELERKRNTPETIAAHLDGENLTEEEERELLKYIDFLIAKRDNEQ